MILECKVINPPKFNSINGKKVISFEIIFGAGINIINRLDKYTIVCEDLDIFLNIKYLKKFEYINIDILEESCTQVNSGYLIENPCFIKNIYFKETNEFLVNKSKNKEEVNEKFLNLGENLHKKLIKLGFEGFIRGEHQNNLINILKDGILYARNFNQGGIDIANKKVLEKTNSNIKDYVRFYYYKRTPTFYNFENQNPNKIIYLVFDWSLVYKNNTIFSDGNMASSMHIEYDAKNYILEERNDIRFDLIFERGSYDPNIVDVKVFRNAEFLVPFAVDVKNFIKKIVFKNNNEMKEFYYKCYNKIEGIEFYKSISVIDESYFNEL